MGRKHLCFDNAGALGEDPHWLVAAFIGILFCFRCLFLLAILFLSGWILFLAGATSYLPQHLKFLTRRARYYLLGSERESFHVDWPTKAEL